jgi:hypothetical protein
VACYLGKAKNPNASILEMLEPFTHKFCGRAFYISNDLPAVSSEDIGIVCNDRCDLENLIAQLSGGARSLCVPVDNLESNWANTVITSIAWNLKSWSAFLTPVAPGQEQEQRKENVTQFRNAPLEDEN